MKCKRLSCALAAAVLLGGFVQSAPAVVLFFDLGDQVGGVQGGPLDGSNPVIEVLPGETASVYLWAIPDADDDKVIAALGHDVVITGEAAAWVSAVQYTLDNPDIGPNPRWSGVALADGLNVADKLVSDQRAVFVPTTEPPFVGGIGSGNLGIDPGYDANSGAVYLGRLDLQIDADAELGSTAELRLAVGPVLITHVTAATWQEEAIFFGFAGGGPEPATASGSEIGATSATADAVISIGAGIPGDLDGDGCVDLSDLAQLLSNYGTTSGMTYEDGDLDADGDVDLSDLAELLAHYGDGCP